MKQGMYVIIYMYVPPDNDDFEIDDPPLPPPLPPSRGGPPTSSHPDHNGFNYQQPRQIQYYTSQHGQPFRYHQPIASFVPLHPDLVVEKYIGLKTPAMMSRLAVKLARESFFGEEVMEQCTSQVLPKTELCNLKLYLVQLFPSLSKPEFEGYWKTCVTSIGQACKGIRTKQEVGWCLLLTCTYVVACILCLHVTLSCALL